MYTSCLSCYQGQSHSGSSCLLRVRSNLNWSLVSSTSSTKNPDRLTLKKAQRQQAVIGKQELGSGGTSRYSGLLWCGPVWFGVVVWCPPCARSHNRLSQERRGLPACIRFTPPLSPACQCLPSFNLSYLSLTRLHLSGCLWHFFSTNGQIPYCFSAQTKQQMPIQKSEQQTDEKAIQQGYFGRDVLCGIMVDEAPWRWQEDKYLSLILDCGLLQIAQTGWKRYLLLDDWLLVVTNVFFLQIIMLICLWQLR